MIQQSFYPDAWPPGLTVIPDFIDQEMESYLVALLDQGEWKTGLRRRVQQFGHGYDFARQEVDLAMPPLPAWAKALGERMAHEAIMTRPDAIIVNEYNQGQGINPHIDSQYFGPTVTSLSLLDTVVMNFERREQVIEVPLERRSVAVVSGEARYFWRHSIPARVSDEIAGVRKRRAARRISVTFRTIL